MSLGLNILLIFIFLVLGSIFSGTELALVSLRGSQIDQMEQEDARGARVAAIARDPNKFLSTVQIGVTLSGFLSASFGESSISPFIVPVVKSWGVPANIAAPLTTIVLTLIISYCSIVISEMVPKRIAMQRTEQIARAVVPAIDVFAKVCKPIIWLIGKNTNGIVRLLGFDPNETESEVSDEELRVLVNTNTSLSKDERTILDDVFDASETIVAEVMRPRADVVFLDGSQSIKDAAAYVREMPYSRYPVTGRDFDDVIGFVHVRDLLDVRDPNATTVADVTREGISLPGTSKLLPSLELLRKRGIQVPRNMEPHAREFVDERKTPTDRLVARLGLSAYYGLHAHTCIPLEPETVFIPFQQHIGKPAVPVKAVGDPVAKGELLAQAAPDGLSANIHASIDGVVTEITPAGARLCRKEV